MREIKFRAWHKFSQQMYNVGYLHFAPNGELYGLLANETMQWGNLLAVKDFDLMQFTGLLDKNGKEIYEGDILNLVFGKHILEVRWGVFSFQFFDVSTHEQKLVYAADLKRLEVIGNIYENKDLLPIEA